MNTRPHVLVAEDDPLVRAVVVDALCLDGYQVEEAADGRELLGRVLRAFGPHEASEALDLIVSDVWLPFCNAITVLERLRAAQRATPVLLITGDNDPEMRPALERLGCSLLEKPFTFEALRSAVGAAIGS
jgi:CheY-like chemotaxis protein